MILADKIIEERKKNGWSQEELAEKLNVTRQSVSKWEGAQSVPDLQRILEMSRLFGVSTDYLLKDELEPAARTEAGDDAADTPLRLVSMEEAQAFLQLKKKNAATVALATFLCVVGAVLLILCGGLSEYGVLPLGENVAAGLGMILLLVCAAVAVALFIRCAQRLRPFAFLEEEEFETAYGVRGLLREKRAEYAEKYSSYTVIGAVLCVLSIVPLFAAVIFTTDNGTVYIWATALLLILAGIGACFFIVGGSNRGAVDLLLREGEFSRRHREEDRRIGGFSMGYWLLATAIFLVWNFMQPDYGRSWIVWPVAGVLYPVARMIVAAIAKDRED